MNLWYLLIPAAIALFFIPIVIEGNRKPMDDNAREDAPGDFAHLRSGVTHFQWHGPPRGPVAVCVHGLTTPSFVWDGMVRGLALMGFRVLTYDLYGRGYSDKPRGPQRGAFFKTQLEELLSHENVHGSFTLIGYSMGGSIATVFAADNPMRVDRMILLAPAGMGVVAGRMARFIARTPVIGDWLMLAFYPKQFRSGVRQESVPDVGVLQLRELEYKGFLRSVLASLRGILGQQLEEDHKIIARYGVPVLALWGQNDDVIPLSAMGKLAQWNRKARQEVISDAGHGLTYTHPEAVLAHIRTHISEVPNRS